MGGARRAGTTTLTATRPGGRRGGHRAMATHSAPRTAVATAARGAEGVLGARGAPNRRSERSRWEAGRSRRSRIGQRPGRERRQQVPPPAQVAWRGARASTRNSPHGAPHGRGLGREAAATSRRALPASPPHYLLVDSRGGGQGLRAGCVTAPLDPYSVARLHRAALQAVLVIVQVCAVHTPRRTVSALLHPAPVVVKHGTRSLPCCT